MYKGIRFRPLFLKTAVCHFGWQFCSGNCQRGDVATPNPEKQGK